MKLKVLALTVLLLPGCRFKSPSLQEQEALAQQGAFAMGVPPWAAQAGSLRANRSSGLIPETFSTETAATKNDPQFARAGEPDEAQRAAMAAAEENAPAEVEPKQVSPLERIEKLCPGIEPDVTAALTTEVPAERTAKYMSVLNRCPNSSDIWLFLAQDYSRANKLVEARRAFEKVLVLDPTSAEARDGLANVNQRLNMGTK